MPMEPAAPANVNATDGEYEDKIVITWDESTSQVDFTVCLEVIMRKMSLKAPLHQLAVS